MTRIPRLLTAFVFVLAAGQAGAAACTLGTVKQVVGDVQVRHGDAAATAARAGDRLCEQDRFLTDAHAVATLRFRDGTEIVVGKDSEFVVQRWREHRVFRANDARFELVKGAFRALTGAFTQRRHTLEIRTPIAAIGVRGTEFWGGIGLTPGGLDVVMLGGKGVYVRNDAGTVELSVPGTGTTVMPGQSPAAPKAWTDEKVKRAVETITP